MMTVVHVKLSEELQLGGDAALQRLFEEVSGADEATLDMSGVGEIDQWLARTLVRLARRRGFDRPPIVLIGVNPILRTVLDRTGLDRLFRVT